MPINRQIFSQKSSSRLTASTIASAAKCRTKEKDLSPVFEPIMSPTSNLTRSRSLRLPQKSPILLNQRKNSGLSSEADKKVSALEKKIQELENEMKEVKEINEFLASERTVLVDSLKEVEDSLDSLRLENIGLKDGLTQKEDMITKLSAKYARNRKVWEENERKATQEIKMLDDIVDHVIDTLKSLPETFRSSDQIQQLLEVLTDDTILKK